MGSKLAIDNWSSSRCQLTLIASECNHSVRTMLLLACLDFSDGLFDLATIRIVNHTFHRLPVVALHSFQLLLFCACNGHSFPFRRNGTEMSPFYASYCTVRQRHQYLTAKIICSTTGLAIKLVLPNMFVDIFGSCMCTKSAWWPKITLFTFICRRNKHVRATSVPLPCFWSDSCNKNGYFCCCCCWRNTWKNASDIVVFDSL